jgi:DNA-binding response OmpR family regulator
MPDKILIVEDEPALRDALEYNLSHQGYAVFAAGDGTRGLDIARREHPDLIVLDVMLPGLDGLELCRILRRESNVPIVMLTARSDEIDKVVGLELGADDYVTKPFQMRELLARIKAMLRRVRLMREETTASEPAAPPPHVAGNLTVDVSRGEARLSGQPLDLAPKELELLTYLVRHRGQAMTRDQILEAVWGWDFSGGTRTVDVHVRWLRTKIERDPAKPERIVTVRAIGYRFEG